MNGMKGPGPNLGDNIISNGNSNSIDYLTSIKKWCSKERLIYLGIGVALLVCIYFYLKFKNASEKKEDLDLYLQRDNLMENQYSENLETNPEDIKPNKVYETPPGYITIPIQAYEQMQNNSMQQVEEMQNMNRMKTIPSDSHDMINSQSGQYPTNEEMQNNLSDEDLNIPSDINELANKLDSTDEDDKIRAQDLTNTEIQSIQQQLNSFKTNTN